MSDIWRSFIGTRVAHAYGWGILYTKATVWQDRNEHDLMHDFAEEVPGYLGNRRRWETLEAVDFSSEPTNIVDNMCKCYAALVAADFFEKDEEKILQAWVSDIQDILESA
jgi:hypothetical protein